MFDGARAMLPCLEGMALRTKQRIWKNIRKIAGSWWQLRSTKKSWKISRISLLLLTILFLTFSGLPFHTELLPHWTNHFSPVSWVQLAVAGGFWKWSQQQWRWKHCQCKSRALWNGIVDSRYWQQTWQGFFNFTCYLPKWKSLLRRSLCTHSNYFAWTRPAAMQLLGPPKSLLPVSSTMKAVTTATRWLNKKKLDLRLLIFKTIGSLVIPKQIHEKETCDCCWSERLVVVNQTRLQEKGSSRKTPQHYYSDTTRK